MTNKVELLEGEELLLEMGEQKPKAESKKRTWRIALKEEENKKETERRQKRTKDAEEEKNA